MRKTFVCDNSMLITIPLGSLRDVQDGRLMPEKFNCVFKDWYKVFVLNGKPRPLGAAQAMVGVFLIALGLIIGNLVCAISSAFFVITGMLSFVAGIYPNMHVTKLAFSLNIISFFSSIGVFSVSLRLHHWYLQFDDGINGLIMSLLVVENFTAIFLIYWLSKAVCRQHFNSLPTILLKLGE